MSDKLRILIICDNETAMQNMRNIVRHHKRLEVEAAASGSEALPMITKEAPYHIIISDISRAGVNTVDILRVAMARNSETRVVVISSFGEQQEVIEAIKSGVHGYLHKPFRPDELNLMLNNITAHFTQKKRIAELGEEITELEAEVQSRAVRSGRLESQLTEMRAKLREVEPDKGSQTELERALADAAAQKTGKHHGYKVFQELDHLEMLRKEHRISEDEYKDFRKIVLDKAYQQQSG